MVNRKFLAYKRDFKILIRFLANSHFSFYFYLPLVCFRSARRMRTQSLDFREFGVVFNECKIHFCCVNIRMKVKILANFLQNPVAKPRSNIVTTADEKLAMMKNNF